MMGPPSRYQQRTLGFKLALCCLLIIPLGMMVLDFSHWRSAHALLPEERAHKRADMEFVGTGDVSHKGTETETGGTGDGSHGGRSFANPKQGRVSGDNSRALNDAKLMTEILLKIGKMTMDPEHVMMLLGQELNVHVQKTSDPAPQLRTGLSHDQVPKHAIQRVRPASHALYRQMKRLLEYTIPNHWENFRQAGMRHAPCAPIINDHNAQVPSTSSRSKTDMNVLALRGEFHFKYSDISIDLVNKSIDGFCADYLHLQEGSFPRMLNENADPIEECVHRCKLDHPNWLAMDAAIMLRDDNRLPYHTPWQGIHMLFWHKVHMHLGEVYHRRAVCLQKIHSFSSGWHKAAGD